MSTPLAHTLKPKSLSDIIGQDHMLAQGSFLYRAIEADEVPSMILYGPPGCGKTSLAHVIAHTTKSEFKVVNAVSSGIKELREVIAEARTGTDSLFTKKTILFIDEIHRFNKKQQDYLLPFVERGVVTLIGATTENPSFEVNAALLSRMQVFVLQALTETALMRILEKGIQESGETSIESEMLQHIARMAQGDARFAINMLEHVLKERVAGKEINEELLIDIVQSKALLYDKNGEEHYALISALHKSMRDSDVDASVYWCMRMIEAGEDPKYIVRRMIRFASEDIGNADITALTLALAVKDVVLFVGYPECDTALVQLAAYLARAPKDNSAYVAVRHTREDIKKFGALGVPLHLRNASTSLMKDWGYGKGYEYAHNNKNVQVTQTHLPEELEGKTYYKNSYESLQEGDEKLW